jgi:nucleoside-diphosphate-sugar epimerase
MSNRVLIIGASSMLGRRLHSYLKMTGCQVFTSGRTGNYDILYDLEDVIIPNIPNGLEVDVVFHCAASFADDSWVGCLQNEKINALSGYIVGEIAAKVGCKHLVYAGSIFSSCSSMTSYGASKLRGEDILEWSLGRNRIQFNSLRFSQLYDEYGECCKHQHWLGRIVAYAFAGQHLRMPAGAAKRNFLHIKDAVSLMCAAAENNITGRLDVCHPESMTCQEVAQLAYDVFRSGGGYEIASEKQAFRDIFIPETSKSFDSLNYWPQISMKHGLEMIKLSGSPGEFGPMDVS